MEQIDQLRQLLDLPDRDVASMVHLTGYVDVPNERLGIVESKRTGDIAIVFVGPESELKGVLRENKSEGTITFEMTLPVSENYSWAQKD